MRTKKTKWITSAKGGIIAPVLFVVILFGILLTSGALVNKSPTDQNERFEELVEESKSEEKKNIQLKDLTFKVQPTIVPSSSCNHDNGKSIVNTGEKYDPTDPDACTCDVFVIECTDKKCSKYISFGNNPVPAGSSPVCGTNQSMFDSWCNEPSLTKQTDGIYCLGKPVIYLYPDYPMLVDVSVMTSGKVIVSDPQIEKTNSWTDVLAHPNGILFYKGSAYRELFYETESQELIQPRSGLVIGNKNLERDLLRFIERLGLTRKDEQNEFLDWWIPRLDAYDSPYWFVSILERDEKDRLDKVIIDPKPDTFIDFIVYFKPLEKSIDVETLILPPTPERKGFTTVEWGGVIGD